MQTNEKKRRISPIDGNVKKRKLSPNDVKSLKSRVHSFVGTERKTIIFHVPALCTQGDKKPLTVLSLFTARMLGTSLKPVILFEHHLAYFRNRPELTYQSINQIIHWAQIVLGDSNPQIERDESGLIAIIRFEFLHIYLTEGPHAFPSGRDVLHIGTGIMTPCHSADRYTGRYVRRDRVIKMSPNVHFENCISLDFGDNFHPRDIDSPGLRMVASCLDYNERLGHGSIMLPLFSEMPWSVDRKNVEKLTAFRTEMHNTGRKVVVVACSLGNINIPLHVVSDNREDWGFIFIGGSVPRDAHCETRHCNFINSTAVEYEDVINLADFWISGGGAGSVSVALYAGVPQYIFPVGAGSDKRSNRQNAIDIGVSPSYPTSSHKGTWKDLFEYISRPGMYRGLLNNAQTVQKKLASEDGIGIATKMISDLSERPSNESLIFRKSGNSLTRVPRVIPN